MADSTLAQWLAPLSLASDAGAALPWERGDQGDVEIGASGRTLKLSQ
jgi:hypothetical protein